MAFPAFPFRADAPYGSHPSDRAVQPRPLRGISDGRSIALPSRFGRIGRTWEKEGDGTTVRYRCRELSVSTLLTLSVWAGLPIRTTDQSALTDGLRLAGSGQRFRPRGGQIADCDFRVSGRAADTAGDRGIADGRSILCPLSQERPQFPESRVGSHVRSSSERHY